MTMDESRSMEEATSLPRDIDPYSKEVLTNPTQHSADKLWPASDQSQVRTLLLRTHFQKKIYSPTALEKV